VEVLHQQPHQQSQQGVGNQQGVEVLHQQPHQQSQQGVGNQQGVEVLPLPLLLQLKEIQATCNELLTMRHHLTKRKVEVVQWMMLPPRQ
jgi:hypothetical protein